MRYELGENGKVLVPKAIILRMVDSGRDGLSTKPAALLACARLFAVAPMDRPDTSWARTVIDYPAAERVFEKMTQQGLLVGKLAHEWACLGVRTYLQNRTAYYATARIASEIQDSYEGLLDRTQWDQAEQMAFRALASLHPEEFRMLTQGFYEDFA